MATLGDYKTYEPVFPEAENCRTDELIGQTIEILASQKKQGERGEYNVILAKLENGKLVSFASGGVAINKWIKAINSAHEFKEEFDVTRKYKEPISAIIVRKISKETGNRYFDLTNP